MQFRCVFFKILRLLFYACVLASLLNIQLAAQSARARIVGTVKDTQGAVLPGATVIVTNTGTGVATKTTTDQNGSYAALELPIGSYKVKVLMDRLRPAVCFCP